MSARSAASRAVPTTLAEMRASARVTACRIEAAAAQRAAGLAALRARLDAEADARDAERAQAAAAERAVLDALVFQHLDPEKLAREPKRIIARTAARFGLTREDVLGRRKLHPIVRCRWAAIAAVRAEHPDYSLPKLGRIFGRDHTTTLYALRRMAALGVPQPPEALRAPSAP